MLVDAHRVVDQLAAGGVEEGGQLAVNQGHRQDGHRHQGEGQEGAASAVAEEDRIPVVDIGKDGACGNGVNKDQLKTFV